MGQVEVKLPPEQQRKNLLDNLRSWVSKWIDAVTEVKSTYQGEEKVISAFSNLENLFRELEGELSPEASMETLLEISESLTYLASQLITLFNQQNPGTREQIRMKIQALRQESPGLSELRKLASLPSLPLVSMSKDLLSSQFSSGGDILELGTEKEKEKIREYQRKGKLLFGTMEGLAGGSAFFKAVSIALAKILNKQSQYYNPDGKGDKKGTHRLSGVPRDRIREIFGESAELEKSLNSVNVPLHGEERQYPFIILSYEELAREVSKTGKISGGKDIDYIRLYINGGYREFETDPKTGDKKPVLSSYVPGLTSRKYFVSDGRGHFVFIPFVVNEGEIVDSTRKDPEVGCILRLSPQYSSTLRGYTSLRSDTIQLIGGGKQKDITMDILSFLVFSRNTTPVLRKTKSAILEKYENKPTYKGRPGKLEDHFREAVQKSIEAKILQEYREEKTPGGETVSVFIYNPDYVKGEIISPGGNPSGE